MESLEILTTAWCPFNCKYCYIPKTPMTVRMHKELEGKLSSLIRDAAKLRIKHIGFWGTEPTLTLSKIDVQELLSNPSLETISFSTSMMYKPEVIREFIMRVAPHKVNVRVQVSLDGPAFITDRNRMEGAAERIPQNLKQLVCSLQGVNLGETTVEFRFKATLTIDNLKEMVREPKLIDEYKAYFEGIERELIKANTNRNVRIARGTYCPTMMVPGKYTSEDGKIFCSFVKECYAHDLKTAYHYRLRRIYDYAYELHKKRMFTCSGGDSNFGYDGSFHICHRSFYLNRDDYVQSVLQTDIDNWDVSLFKLGHIQHVRRYITRDLVRLQYVLRGHHDFWKFDVSSVVARLQELAACGQVSELYRDDHWAVKFAIFSQAGLDCPMENLLNTGSIHIVPVSLIRLFCNGAFEEIDRRVRSEISGRK
ncbi:MAG: hypothetical protein DRJ38_00115 [Thermoprotei archaeon]|nr:MAG: hypothetical protein DRJ38_00115 [Thermoprotei archaeon]